ncbi:MAG: hypothetical protein KAJ19_20095 [Gammaproteobacteria bacterium]|nr:hypothetical protein [Gammaproteobacteria bacterium]
MGMMDAASNGFVGTNFRFRNDDGDHSPFAGTWLAALNTNISLVPSADQFRLRFAAKKVDFSGNHTFELAYSLNSGGYAQITDDSSTPLTNVSTSYFSNGEHTIAYTSPNQVYTDTWADLTNNAIITDDAQSDTGVSGWDATSAVKGMSIEMCMKFDLGFTPRLKAGDTLDIRIYLGGMVAPTGGWEQTARITILPGYHHYIPEHLRRMILGSYRAN